MRISQDDDLPSRFSGWPLKDGSIRERDGLTLLDLPHHLHIRPSALEVRDIKLRVDFPLDRGFVHHVPYTRDGMEDRSCGDRYDIILEDLDPFPVNLGDIATLW